MGDLFLTAREVCERTGIPYSTITQLCREGRLPGASKVGRQYRIHWKTFKSGFRDGEGADGSVSGVQGVEAAPKSMADQGEVSAAGGGEDLLQRILRGSEADSLRSIMCPTPRRHFARPP